MVVSEAEAVVTVDVVGGIFSDVVAIGLLSEGLSLTRIQSSSSPSDSGLVEPKNKTKSQIVINFTKQASTWTT